VYASQLALVAEQERLSRELEGCGEDMARMQVRACVWACGCVRACVCVYVLVCACWFASGCACVGLCVGVGTRARVCVVMVVVGGMCVRVCVWWWWWGGQRLLPRLCVCVWTLALVAHQLLLATLCAAHPRCGPTTPAHATRPMHA
jgi:hypothetical protein